jgi:hypothetical protein
LSAFSRVTVIFGNAFGETPDQSVTRSSLGLKVPIGMPMPFAPFD